MEKSESGNVFVFIIALRLGHQSQRFARRRQYHINYLDNTTTQLIDRVLDKVWANNCQVYSEQKPKNIVHNSCFAVSGEQNQTGDIFIVAQNVSLDNQTDTIEH